MRMRPLCRSTFSAQRIRLHGSGVCILLQHDCMTAFWSGTQVSAEDRDKAVGTQRVSEACREELDAFSIEQSKHINLNVNLGAL